MLNRGSEQRGAPHFAVVMEAHATYLDTLNPAEDGAPPVCIRLEHGRRVFQSQAKVAYKVPQMGLGVALTHPLRGELLETVRAWVSEAAAVIG